MPINRLTTLFLILLKFYSEKILRTGRIASIMAIAASAILFALPRTSTAQKRSGTVKPEMVDHKYRITIGNQEMLIDPERGGRIVSLLMDNKDFLTDSTINNFNWGSTFWLSPQRDWNWPPSAEIDNKPYRASIENNTLIMTSMQDPKTGLVVTKNISGESASQSFVLQYTITNRSNLPQHVAPWEVTRVKPNGIAFFPAGKDNARGGLLPSTTLQDGIFWFTYDKQKLPLKGDRQIYADGSEGWLGQVNDNLLLLKKFPDISPEDTAPGEGEVELYASEVSDDNPGYVEIEHQGAFTTLQPGASFAWTCTWIFRKLPANVQVGKGNKALIEFVRKLIKE